METRTITIKDFNSICRVCLCNCTEDNSLNMHRSLLFKKSIGYVLSQCTSIQATEQDTLPEKLCIQCLKQLTVCHTFIEKCQKSHQILQHMLNQKHNPQKPQPHEEPQRIPSPQLPNAPPIRPNKPGNFPCLQCPKRFRSRLHLDLHTRTHTKEKKTYNCDHCPSTFSSLTYLKLHTMEHTGDEPNRCKHCDKQFLHPSKLHDHVLKHTVEKMHVCEVCGAEFRHASSMGRHVRKHRIGGEGKVHGDLSQPQPPHRQHRNRCHPKDKPFECQHCPLSFSSRHHLRIHERTHTGDRPHLCGHCGKRFTGLSQLRNHEYVHTGEKPYVCKFCEGSFRNSRDLTKHVAMHRGKEGGGGETEKGAVEEMVFVDCGEQRAVVKVEKVEVSEGEDG